MVAVVKKYDDAKDIDLAAYAGEVIVRLCIKLNIREKAVPNITSILDEILKRATGKQPDKSTGHENETDIGLAVRLAAKVSALFMALGVTGNDVPDIHKIFREIDFRDDVEQKKQNPQH